MRFPRPRRRGIVIGSSVALAAVLVVGAGAVAVRAVGHEVGILRSVASAASAAREDSDAPPTGELIRRTIPSPVSHFKARPALVYLPPAEFVPHPAALPVAILLSGQSKLASPEDLQSGGHIESVMNGIAAANHGVTPIVVVPDQLESGPNNPMCVDGPLGNSRTYLTVDVVRWIKAHYRVETAAKDWTIGGFSEGGTCAIELGASDPGLFGNLIDNSGERAPIVGTSVSRTISVGFSGSAAAYRESWPQTQLAAHAPYADSWAYFAAGADDPLYGPVMPWMAGLARKAGMHVTTWVIPGGHHNWGTGSAGIAAGMRWLEGRLGL